MSTTDHDSGLLELTVEVVAAYVGNNSVPSNEVAALIRNVHSVLSSQNTVVEPQHAAEEQKPAVPIRKSIQDEYLVCLEDGLKFKSLKRHLRSRYGMTPDDYRAKWRLDADYPMVAPAYARARSALAKASGLGQQRRRTKE